MGDGLSVHIYGRIAGLGKRHVIISGVFSTNKSPGGFCYSDVFYILHFHCSARLRYRLVMKVDE